LNRANRSVGVVCGRRDARCAEGDAPDQGCGKKFALHDSSFDLEENASGRRLPAGWQQRVLTRPLEMEEMEA